MATTKELIQQLGLDPNLEWKRGWKMVSKVVGGATGQVSYLSCACPRRRLYCIGKATTRLFNEGPLVGFQYKRDARRFYNLMGGVIYSLFPMLYIQANSYIEQGMVRIAVWQGIDAAGRPIRGREISKMPKGTVYAATIVVYGEEIEI